MADTTVVKPISSSFGRRAGRSIALRSPVVAMLWENWRLTRVEAAWKLALTIIGGLTVMVVFAALAPNETIRAFGAVVALIVIVMPNIMGWFSIPKINGARAGFPYSLHYSRPVRTAVLVGVPMAYQVVMPTAMYLAVALLLRVVSGYPFPLLPVAAWILALNLTHPLFNWSMPSRLFTVIGSLVIGLVTAGFFSSRFNAVPDGFDWHDSPNLWPTLFAFPLTDYAVVGVIALASFGLTVVGVARQRRGDAPEGVPWMSGTGYPAWFINLFRLPCPTSSAIRAQIWFELKSRGLPVLAIGLLLTIVNPLVFAISVRGGQLIRVVAVMCGMFSVLTVPVLGANAFGLRWKPGRLYPSSFEMTLPCASARLAGLKVLVRSVCVLISLIAVGASVWTSMAFIAVGQIHEPLKGYQPLRSWQSAIETAIRTLTGYQLLSLAVVASIGIVILVAAWAAVGALVTRYRRHLGILAWLVLLHGILLVLLVMTGYRGFASREMWDFLLRVLVWTTRWIDAPAVALATVYISWRAFSERLLTPRSASVAVIVSPAFGVAWVTLLRAAGVRFVDMPATYAFWMLSPVLLPVMASVLAPWSLSRLRHV